jgi:lysylphosphatidylglycerol synthetase-like protein (DUF2156 family)
VGNTLSIFKQRDSWSNSRVQASIWRRLWGWVPSNARCLLFSTYSCCCRVRLMIIRDDRFVNLMNDLCDIKSLYMPRKQAIRLMPILTSVDYLPIYNNLVTRKEKSWFARLIAVVITHKLLFSPYMAKILKVSRLLPIFACVMADVHWYVSNLHVVSLIVKRWKCTVRNVLIEVRYFLRTAWADPV